VISNEDMDIRFQIGTPELQIGAVPLLGAPPAAPTHAGNAGLITPFGVPIPVI
jgi:hypothetical protein